MDTGIFARNQHRFSKVNAIIIAAAAFILVGFADTRSDRKDNQNPHTIAGETIRSFNIKMNTREQANATPGTLSAGGDLAALNLATAWLNSKPLSRMDLKGKVVLINFWTYTCINWLRTLPYIRAWAQKYQDNGLVVVGVHTPEFSFEKNLGNVRKLTRDLGVTFPVAVDNGYGIWDAFNNQYWPALYFIDANGKIRHHQFGEGDYERSETVIRQLLTESGATAIDQNMVVADAKGIEVAPDWNNLHSPENYLGYLRTEHFASIGGAVPGRRYNYTAPGALVLNQWALSGNWKMQEESVLLNEPNGKISYGFEARDLHIVMGPVKKSPVRFRVLIDGHAPGADHGIDIDEQGYGLLNEQRLYQLIRQKSAITVHQFEIEFFDKGAEAFSFTFG